MISHNGTKYKNILWNAWLVMVQMNKCTTSTSTSTQTIQSHLCFQLIRVTDNSSCKEKQYISLLFMNTIYFTDLLQNRIGNICLFFSSVKHFVIRFKFFYRFLLTTKFSDLISLHWFMFWLVNFLSPSYYPNQCWVPCCHINGLMQEWCNPIANTLELQLLRIKPLIWHHWTSIP